MAAGEELADYIQIPNTLTVKVTRSWEHTGADVLGLCLVLWIALFEEGSAAPLPIP